MRITGSEASEGVPFRSFLSLDSMSPPALLHSPDGCATDSAAIISFSEAVGARLKAYSSSPNLSRALISGVSFGPPKKKESCPPCSVTKRASPSSAIARSIRKKRTKLLFPAPLAPMRRLTFFSANSRAEPAASAGGRLRMDLKPSMKRASRCRAMVVSFRVLPPRADVDAFFRRRFSRRGRNEANIFASNYITSMRGRCIEASCNSVCKSTIALHKFFASCFCALSGAVIIRFVEPHA